MNEDIDESNLTHLLTNLSNNDDLNNEFQSTLLIVKEIISLINFKILSLNKKSKKNLRMNDNNVQGRENSRN
nr:IMV membrane protein [Wadden Sea poxvirus]